MAHKVTYIAKDILSNIHKSGCSGGRKMGVGVNENQTGGALPRLMQEAPVSSQNGKNKNKKSHEEMNRQKVKSENAGNNTNSNSQEMKTIKITEYYGKCYLFHFNKQVE